MTNTETLTKAIEKAQLNGWMTDWKIKHSKDMGWIMTAPGEAKVTDEGMFAPVTYMQSEFDIIYDRQFAKALWGEEDCFIYVEYASENIDAIKEYPQGSIKMKLYQFHLQQMVIAPNPISYLEENM